MVAKLCFVGMSCGLGGEGRSFVREDMIFLVACDSENFGYGV